MKSLRIPSWSLVLCAIAIGTVVYIAVPARDDEGGLNCAPENARADDYVIFTVDDMQGMRINGVSKIPPEYKDLRALDENLISAQRKSDETYGLLDENNTWICQPRKNSGRLYDENDILLFRDGYRRGDQIRAVAVINPEQRSDLDLFGVIDENCEYIISPEYLHLWPFINDGEDYYIFTKVFFKKQKARKTPPNPREAGKIKSLADINATLKSGALVAPKKTDYTKDGIMDENGDIIIPADYDRIDCDEKAGHLIATTSEGQQILEMPAK